MSPPPTNNRHGMVELRYEQLIDQWADVESAVDATDGIDQWCSALDWVVPVATGFAPQGKRLILKSSDGNGYAILGYYRRDELLMLSGIEPLWGFASPIFGSNIAALTDELGRALNAIEEWSILILAGLPEPPHPVTTTIAAGLKDLGVSVYTEGITRRIADLSRGYEVWLEARTPRFRRNLRQAVTKAERVGVAIVDVADQEDLFEQMLDIEQKSWKGEDDSGITAPEMSAMYRTMIDRLRQRGRLHAFVARIGSNNVGYILGGIRNRRYRGLQISFVREHRDLSIGNLLQHHQICHLIKNDLADCYDMGMDFDYKRRWADSGETSITLVLHRSSATQTIT